MNNHNIEEGTKSLVNTIGFLIGGALSILLLYCLRDEQSSRRFARRLSYSFYIFIYLLFLIPILGVLWWLCSLILSPIVGNAHDFLVLPALILSPVLYLIALPLSTMTGQHVTDISSMLKVIIGGTIWTILVLVLSRVTFRGNLSNLFAPFIWFFKAIGTLTTKTLKLIEKLGLAMQKWQIVQEAREQRAAMRHAREVQEEIFRQEMAERENIYNSDEKF